MTALAVVSLDRGRPLALDTTARSLLGDDLPARRRRRDGRASARAPLRDRRLPRRGRRRGDHRLRHAGSGARARRRRRTSSPCSTDIPTKFARGNRVLVLERRLRACSRCSRSARAAFRSTISSAGAYPSPPGCPTPTSCAPTSCPSGRALGYLGSRRAHARTSSTFRSAARATAASTRPPPTSGALWTAFFAGQIVSAEGVEEMTRPRSDATGGPPLRARILAPRVDGDRDPRGLRRRRLVPVAPRSRRGHDVHGDLELERRRVAGRSATSPTRSGSDSDSGPGRPGARADDEGRIGEALAAALPKLLARLRIESGDVRARRPDAERVRLPPLLERLVLDGHRQRLLLDVGEARLLEELRQVALGRSGQLPLARARGIELADDLPVQAERPSAAAVIPDARGDDASGRASRGASRRGRAPGRFMKWTTSCAIAVSKLSSSNGRSSAAACSTVTSGCRSRRAATKGSDGSTAVTAGRPDALDEHGGERARSRADVERRVVRPRRLRSPRTSGASGVEYRPMNLSYASAATAKLIGADSTRWLRASRVDYVDLRAYAGGRCDPCCSRREPRARRRARRIRARRNHDA